MLILGRYCVCFCLDGIGGCPSVAVVVIGRENEGEEKGGGGRWGEEKEE